MWNGSVFDASAHKPEQIGGGAKVPPGKYAFRIVNTSLNDTKDKDGMFLKVDFHTNAGEIPWRLNVKNASKQAEAIAEKQLITLCHVTGIFRVDMNNEGKELIGGEGMLEVGEQTDKDGKPNGYTEVKKLFYKDGNEPGKEPAGGNASSGFGSQPVQQQPQGGFTQQPQQQQPQAQPNTGFVQQPQPEAQPNTGGPRWSK